MNYLTWLRSKVGHSLIPLVYATGLVRDADRRILFQHRTDFPCWGLPGGVLEPGESPTACLRREVHEETGLEVNPVRLAAVLSDPRHTVRYPNDDLVQQVTFFFECAVVGGTMPEATQESSALSFFPPGEIPTTLPWYRLAVECLDQDHTYFDPPDFSAAPPSGISTWSALRRQTGPEPLILPGASAYIRDEGGRVLLARRRDSGLWILPGGLLELGENLGDCAVRETREETGLDVEPLGVRGVFGGHRVDFPGGDILFPIATWFDCRIGSGVIRPDGEEIDQVEFHSVDRLPTLVAGLEERLRKARSPSHAPVFN